MHKVNSKNADINITQLKSERENPSQKCNKAIFLKIPKRNNVPKTFSKFTHIVLAVESTKSHAIGILNRGQNTKELQATIRDK